MAAKVAAVGIAVVGLAALIFTGIYVVDASIQTSRHDVTVTNESFSPVNGGLSTFDNSELPRADYDESVTVRNATDDTTVLESGNYTWFQPNGTLKTLSNSYLANVSTAEITYGYEGQRLRQTRLTSIMTEMFGGIVPIVFVGFISMALVAAAVLGRVA